MKVDLQKIFWPVFLAILTLTFAFHPIQNLDFWWHLSTAKWIVEHGALPPTDPFTFTAQQIPWIYNGWLGSLVIYLAFVLGGNIGVAFLQLLLVGTILGLIYKVCTLKGRASTWLAVLFFIGAYGLSFNFFIWPNMFTLLFFSILLYFLANDERFKWRMLFFVPISFAFWINLHGGALLGVVMIAVFYVGRLIGRRFEVEKKELLRQVLIVLLGFFAIFINPYGAKLVFLPFHYAIDPVIASMIQAWKPVWEFTPRTYIPLLLYFAFVVAAIVNVMMNFKKLGMKWAGLSLLILVVSVRYVRFMTLFILVQMPLIYWGFKGGLSKLQEPPRRFIIIASVFVMLFVYQFGIPLTIDGIMLYPEWNIYHSEVTPRKAVDFIVEQKLQGPMLNDMVFGGYLTWRLWPEQKVFVDGRIELYTTDFYKKYDSFSTNHEVFEELVRTYDIHYLVLSVNRALREQKEFNEWLVKNGQWKLLYSDTHAIIYLKNS